MTVLRTALKFAFSKRNAQRTTSLMILFGIAVSMMAILIIGTVVDALQSRQTDSLRAIESFDLIVESSLSEEELKKIPGITSCYEFAETFGVLPNDSSNSALRIRALDFDSYFKDSRLLNELNYSYFSQQSICFIPSVNIYSSLFLSRNENVEFTFLKKGKTATLVPFKAKFSIDGIYSCSDSVFGESTCFMDIQMYKQIMGDTNLKKGVFISDTIKNVSNKIFEKDSNAKITSWQEYNKAVYSALLLEKVLIYIFLAFMFIILCTNLKNSTSRLIENRKKDGAILRAVGFTLKDLINIFMVQGLFLTFCGLVIGSVFGYLFISNISSVLSAFSFGGNLGLFLLEMKFSFPLTVLIAVLVLFASGLFLLFGCRNLYKHEIMEVFSNELN